jgi:hypothetical protein
MAGSTDGVPRKPVHGRHGAADAAVHDSAAAASSPCSPSSSLWLWWCSAMVLTGNSKLVAMALRWVRVIKTNGRCRNQDGVLPFLFLQLVRGGC